MRDRYILIIAGYGGHSGYGLAVAHELARYRHRENIVLVAEGFDFIAERFRGLGEVLYGTLPRKPGEPLYRGIHRWFKSLYESIRLIYEYDIGVVFATGSNFSITPSLTTRFLRGIGVYTIEAIEHFTKPSRAIKILEKTGSRVFLHWDEQLEIFPRGIVTGPVYEPPMYKPRDEGYVLVTTGTLGYRELFDSIEELKLDKVVLQTGDIDPEPYVKKNPSWVVFRYTSDIHKWISGASIVITQQGLTASIASLAYGKPVILIYNPRVVLGAPRRDIEIYAEKINAIYIDKPTPRVLRKAIENISKPSKIYPNGAGKIARILIETIETHKITKP